MDSAEDSQYLPAVRAVLVQDWQVALTESRADASDWEMLTEALAARILYMMNYRHERLMAALYILDISERRYLQAMDQPTQADRAHDLALAILERETEKIQSREKYRRKEPLDNEP